MNQKLAEARILAARKMPYLTHRVITLIPVERPGLGTMAVDEYCRMYFDPAFLDGATRIGLDVVLYSLQQ